MCAEKWKEDWETGGVFPREVEKMLLALFCFPPHPPSHTCAHTYVFHMLQPEEMDARLLSALIVGIRRAFPFVAAEVSIVPFHLS